MNKTVLITGASSGIGYEFAKIFSKNNYNLVLVSENKKELEDTAREMENQYDVKVKPILKDLSKPYAAKELYDDIIAHVEDISVLVNNAGFGISGKFTDLSVEKHTNLIQVNVVALTQLCRLFGADMVKRR